VTGSGTAGRTRIRARLAGALAGAALVAGLTGCSSVTTEADATGLHYNGHVLIPTDPSFEDCVKTSTQRFDGPGDQHYLYPAGQRTFRFDSAPGAQSGPISVVSRDNVQLAVAGVATFNLETDDCTDLRKFHENIGIKYKAYMDGGETSDGWLEMLNTYIKQPLDRAMDAAAQEFTWKDLYNNPAVKTAWEKRVGQLAPEFVRQTATEDYFKNFSLTIQKPQPPDNIVQALAAEQQAILENSAQIKKNDAARTKYNTFTDCKRVLSEGSCVLLYGIDSGKITMVPQDSIVNVPPKQAP
jgi:hypothetical protein